ncbi:MAG TPA: phosphomannomutase, partial [Thermoanaerobacter sp.]|nr:phosphomannomutase [Thermoanaerobacter sp.]
YYIAEKGEFEEGTGNVKYAYPINSYINMIKEKVKLGDRKLKVVVDCGNGTGSYFYPDVIYNLGCEVYPLYCESDPTFPNHFPDPVKEENLKDLIEEVKRVNADLGIAFDGDGDRIGVVDDKGNVIWGDMLMILYWREIMKKHPGADAIVEVKCSQALVEEIERLGGKPIFFKTGHSLIKAKMKELGAVFTGEMSGHMFFADEYYGFDDAAYAAARLLRILSNTDKSLSELLADVPKYPATPEIRLECDDEKKFDVVKGVTEYFKEKGYNIIDVDGARVLFDGGWGLVRASNTGPELIVRCEAKTEEKLEAIKKELSEALAKFSVEFK